MSDHSTTIRRAAPEELGRVEELLAANDLPSRDVRDKRECFFVASHSGEDVGVGGVEVHGSDGLLRSIVVDDRYRGRGHGGALCAALEDRARANGVEALYLLTTTAAEFFREMGYEETDREMVPSNIGRTSQFTDLCPASATCMVKVLDRGDPEP